MSTILESEPEFVHTKERAAHTKTWIQERPSAVQMVKTSVGLDGRARGGTDGR